MATSLLALLDDIASVLDDVSILTKVAAKKTAGVLGDDLALNAEQVTGVKADRELPVVWAVAKGSLVNKAILVPSALLISAWLPWAVTILLMIGGLFLCFEGAEKLAHRFIHSHEDEHQQRAQRIQALADGNVDMVAFENDKVRGAIRTDFILSAEIIVITLGIVAGSPLPTRIAVLVGIAMLMTVGVYGLVAGIVKLDDLGIALSRHGGARATVGRALLVIAPWLMKFLSIAGTAAMFLVGGGILSHNIPWLHHLSESFGAALAGVPAMGAALAAIGPTLFDAVVGLAAGFVVVAILSLGKKLFARPPAPAGGH